MIRTYSLLRALDAQWQIHFVVLYGSSDPITKTRLNDFYSTFPNVTIEQYGGSSANINLVETFRAQGRFRTAVAMRDQLKRLGFMRAVFLIVNLPLNLFSLIRKYTDARQFVRKLLDSSPFDAILLDYTKLAFLAPVIRMFGVTKILNVHNAESDLAREMISAHQNGSGRRRAWLDWQIYRFYEKNYVPSFDILLAPTKADAQFHSSRRSRARKIVFPNGVDTSVLHPLPSPEEPLSIIFPGRMDYPPNADAMIFFCKEVLPRIAASFPSIRFYIVGKKPPAAIVKLQSPQVIVTGYVDDVQPFWRKASVLVVPLAVGGGTRIKILEAMALGRPVISTTKGCEGLEVADRKHLLVADNAEKFAESVIDVLGNREAFDAMTLAARKLVEQKYSFSALAAVLEGELVYKTGEPPLPGERHIVVSAGKLKNVDG